MLFQIIEMDLIFIILNKKYIYFFEPYINNFKYLRLISRLITEIIIIVIVVFVSIVWIPGENLYIALIYIFKYKCIFS